MLRNTASNPGAVIIDGHGRGDLGVVRSLGRIGAPIYLFTDNHRSPVAASGLVTKTLPLPPAEAGDDARVRALMDAGSEFRYRPVFFSTGDSSAVLFSRHREQLERFYSHHLSAPELIEDVYDKIRFAQLARARGLDVPFSVTPRTADELEAVLDELAFPVVVKPAEKRRWAEHPEIVRLAHGNVKAVRIETPAALREFYRIAAPYDNAMVIQNYIEGRDEQIYELHTYIDRDGDVVGVFTGRKLRTYPIHCGVGSFVISVYEPGVVEVGLRTLRKIGYRGHAAVQLKRLPDGNRFEVFEINCRYSAWNELHTRAGVNLPYAAYRDCLGEKQPTLPRQREGMRWIDLEHDLRALADYRRCGEWNIGAWARSYVGRNYYAFFDWRDPLPGILPEVRRLRRISTFPLRWTRRQWAKVATANQ